MCIWQKLAIWSIFFLLPSALSGQTATATLSGTIYDPAGAIVSSASILIKSSESGLVRNASTDSAGAFRLLFLPPGRYSLSVSHSGFAPALVEPLVLNVGEQSSIEVNLKVGSAQDAVTVYDDLPLLRDNGSAATVISRQFIENQPLNGRSFQSLVELAPGVTLTKTDVTTGGQFSVNGQRSNTNYFTVDGVSANFGVNGSATLYESSGGVLPAYSALGGTNNLASVDAVQEFRVETSTYAPEYGRQPGAQVAIVTRSGTNQFHGTAFNYLRNDKLDANDWFANRNRIERPALRQNDFGFVLGGPARLPSYDGRNRTFFFVSYEGLRLRQPAVTSPILVPTLTARQDATGYAANILNAFPLPNGAVSAADPNLATYVGSFSNPSTLNATSFRIDQRLGDRVTVFGRYNYAPSRVDQRAVFGTPNTVTTTDGLTRTITIGATAVISSSLNNEVRFNDSRAELSAASALDSFGGATGASTSSLLPSFTDSFASGSITIGAQPTYLEFGLNAANVQRQMNFNDTLSWTSGSHSVKFGFDWRRLAPEYFGSPFRQLMNFTSVNQVLSGTMGSAFVISANVPRIYPRYQNFSSFIQDTWRVSSSLTLTYGLRWDINPAPTEKNGAQPYTATDAENPSQIALSRPDRLYSTRYNNIAPRFGVAYRPFRSQSTVIRGGVGLFHDLGYAFTGSAYSSTIFPYGQLRVLSNIPFAQLETPPPPFSVTPPYGRLFAYSPDFNVPYSVQYNLTVEQGIGTSDRISVGYVGSQGRRLGRVTSLRSPSSLPTSFTRVDLVTSDGTADYNALQMQYERRLRKGLQTLVSYSFAKSLDLVSDESIVNLQAPAVRRDPTLDRGPSSFDVRHVFSMALSYNVPGIGNGATRTITSGWGVDGFVRGRSALPVNVVTGTDLLGLGLTNVARPNLVSGAPLYMDDSNVAGGRRINRAAFSTPDAGVQGNLGRNVLRGFGMGQVDISLRRQFRLWESGSLQFRADAFNILNHPNFSNPAGELSNTNFGTSTQMLGRGLGSAGINGGFSPLYQTGGPRSMQLALRFQF